MSGKTDLLVRHEHHNSSSASASTGLARSFTPPSTSSSATPNGATRSLPSSCSSARATSQASLGKDAMRACPASAVHQQNDPAPSGRATVPDPRSGPRAGSVNGHRFLPGGGHRTRRSRGARAPRAPAYPRHRGSSQSRHAGGRSGRQSAVDGAQPSGRFSTATSIACTASWSRASCRRRPAVPVTVYQSSAPT